MKEKLHEYALVAEIVSGVAIVVTLIFLIYEIRGNTSALQATAIQNSTDTAREMLFMLASDADINRIDMIGSQDPSQLSDEDRQ